MGLENLFFFQQDKWLRIQQVQQHFFIHYTCLKRLQLYLGERLLVVSCGRSTRIGSAFNFSEYGIFTIRILYRKTIRVYQRVSIFSGNKLILPFILSNELLILLHKFFMHIFSTYCCLFPGCGFIHQLKISARVFI